MKKLVGNYNLGNPSNDGYVLSSNSDGDHSWVGEIGYASTAGISSDVNINDLSVISSPSTSDFIIAYDVDQGVTGKLTLANQLEHFR